MKIDKATEIITAQITGGPTPHPQDYIDAMKLGIEALERIKVLRASEMASPRTHLPGETDD